MSAPAFGFVSLVGAGPGDPELITVAGLDRLRRAEVVVYDRLANPTLLAEAPAMADRIDVGKAAGAHTRTQAEIEQLLVDRAQAGDRVVRLKGGDPFVFGRGGEEALALIEAGVEFEVVPGVTSAIAAPAYAGIPVTHRGIATSFAVITGHEDDAKSESQVAWERIAAGADTLLFLMGRRTLPEIAQELIKAGRDPATPAAVVRWGTTSQQSVVTGTLTTIADVADEAGLTAPVVIIVGEVVRLRDRLHWYEDRPLFGKRVLITRTREQASSLAEQLRREGAEPVEFPSIEIAPADPAPARDAVDALAAGHYAWAIFTSANGVRLFFERVREVGQDTRIFSGVRIGTIGTETARALDAQGLRADVVPDRFVAEALAEAILSQRTNTLAGAHVLLPRAAGARDVLPDMLRAQGAIVDDVPLYVAQRPAQPEPAALALFEQSAVDIATFTASSTVTGCLDLLDGRVELLQNVFIACIGPVTARTAEAAGLHVDLVSPVHTVPGLIDALHKRFGEVTEHA